MKEKAISLADVAKIAGVSITTASRVISDANYPVAAETRKKVLFAAEKLNYVTRSIGRALATGRTRTIGVITSDISEPFYGEILRGAEEVSQKSGLIITLLSHDRDIERELQYIRFLRGFEPDGIIVGSCSSNRQHMQRLSKEFAELYSMGIPVVCLQRHLLLVHTIRVDSIEMAYIVTNYLLSLGHRNIAFITGTPEWLPTDDRLLGYQKALDSKEILIDPMLVTCGNWTTREAYNAVTRLLKERVSFSAVIASNDTMAIGAMKALMEAGLKIPDDVSIAGMNNIPSAQFLQPALTTVAVPMRKLGAGAVELMIDLTKNYVAPFEKILPFELIIRQSTAPYKRRSR